MASGWLMAWLVLLASLHTSIARPYILFANRKDIRLLEITNNKARAPTNIIVKNLEDAAALDYFLEESQVCWSEINREVIRCAKIDPYVKGKVVKRNIVSTGLLKPEGLACDWIGKKIYWTDSDTKRIEVTGLSGVESERAVLVWSGLDLPRALSLAPADGLMFWSDWGHYPKIEVCGMNGDLATRKVIVDNDIVWPNGITLDFEARRLFWLEAKLGYIASVDWNGQKRKTIYVAGNRQALPQPFAITMSATSLFWTDWDTNSLYSYNISTDQVERLKVRGKLSPMDIRVFEPNRQPKGSSPCNQGNGGCSHLCLAAPYPPSYTCACPTGFKLLNKTTCADNNAAILLVAARESIIKVSLDTTDFTDRHLPFKSVVNSIAIDYDPVEGRVYWTDLEDDSRQSIRSALLVPQGEDADERDVVTTDVDHPDGVAVDWVGRNLYWTDSGTDRIEVSRLDGNSRRVVISEDMDEPRSLVLDLVRGRMFWSDWGRRPRIERAWMDGRRREVIVDSDLIWPNGIALDTAKEKLYWCDAKMDRIEVAHLDGSQRAVIIDHDLPHPFGFTLLGDHIYWTDWQERSIQRANKAHGTDKTLLVSHLDDLMGAKAVMTSPPKEVNNSCANSNCSHLCLYTPEGRVCACPTGHELTVDNVTCVVPDAFLLYTRRDDIRRISIDSPNSNLLIPLKGVVEASALDYHRVDGRIYWSDIELKTISRAFLNGSGLEVVVEFGLDFPKGLAVDWRSGNLYWSDAGTGRLEMAKLDGSRRRVLVWQDLESPESLVVTSKQLLWSSWGSKPCIEEAGLDGSLRKVIVANSGRATSLTVDEEGDTLYWSDQDSLTVRFISLKRLDGAVTTISSGQHPFSLALYSSSLYITDWAAHTVSRRSLPLTNNTSPAVLQNGLDYVMDLLAYTSIPPDADDITSACSSSPCSALCAPSSSSYTCLCPSHYTLDSDGVNCTGPSSFLLFSQKNKISRLLLDPSMPDEVPDMVLPIKRARSIQAVSYDSVEGMIYWVDHGRGEQPARQVIRRSRDTGMVDRVQLFDRQDRFLPYDLVVDPWTQTLYWTCANTNTINATRLGEKLRPLGPVLVGGDELQPRLLALHPPSQQLVVSMAGELGGASARLEALSLVSGERRLLVEASVGAITALTIDRASDGQAYWADIIHKQVEAVELVGENGERRVVVNEGVVEPVGLAVLGQWLYWADRDQARVTRVDKWTGTNRQIVLSHVPRLSSLTAVPELDLQAVKTHPCFSGGGCSHFCAHSQGVVTCSCPLGLLLAADNRTCGSPPTCALDEFTCVTHTSGPACIPMTWRCDGQPECADKSDELDCPECGPNQFRCQSSQCVPESKLCDGTADCDDRTDEKLCCNAETEFQCAVTGECVDRLKLCDGEHDCGDSSDELLASCSALQRAGGSPGAPCCPDHQPSRLGSEDHAAGPTTTSVYLIGVFVALITLFFLSLIVAYYRRRSVLVSGTMGAGLETESRRPLAPSSAPPVEIVGQQQQERGRAVGADPVGVASAVAGSSNGLLYDRSHVTGASSTGGTSSSGCAAGAQAPPGSPATSIGTKLSRLGPSSHRSKSMGRSGKQSFVAGLPTGYRFYTHRAAAPPCTPCSTDVAEESDYCAGPLYNGGRPHFTSRAGSTVEPSRSGGYDSETYREDMDFPNGELPSLMERGRYAPPPTTPLYLSDYCGEDCLSGDCDDRSSRAPSPTYHLGRDPPSPTTERSFFLNPCLPGPPPSPVPGPPRLDQSLGEGQD